MRTQNELTEQELEKVVGAGIFKSPIAKAIEHCIFPGSKAERMGVKILIDLTELIIL